MSCKICEEAAPYVNTYPYGILDKRIDRLADFCLLSVSTLAISIISTLGLSLISLAIASVGFTVIGLYKKCCRFHYYNLHYRDHEVVDVLHGILAAATACSIVSFIPIFTAKVAIASAIILTISYIGIRVLNRIRGLSAFETLSASSESLLGVAIRTNRLWMVKLCLFLGANPNLKTIDGSLTPLQIEGALTPLQLACRDNRLEIAQTLLRYNANPNNSMSDPSPMMSAVNNGNPDLVRILLQAGAYCTDLNDEISPLNRAIILAIECKNRGDADHLERMRRVLLELYTHQPSESRETNQNALMDMLKSTNVA